LQARILLGLKRGEAIAYTSHRVDSAQESFRGLVALVEESPVLAPLLEKVSYANGKEAIALGNGGRAVFGTRSSRTGRGFSLDLWIADEAHILALEAHSALMPATSARARPPQVWYAGTAVDETTNEHGLVLARLRERGIAGDAGSLAYFEWSAELLDDEGNELRPEQVTAEMVDDEALWAQANPALGHRITIEHLRAERAAMDDRGWLVERLGVGAWPDTTGVASAPITGEEWAELLDRRSKRVGEIVLAFDVSPDRHCALVVCGRRGLDDLMHLEVLRTAPGSAWLQDELERLHDKYDVRSIVCDDYGGNRAMARELESARLPVRTVSGGEHAAACGKLLDLVAEQGFRHIGQPEFVAALRGAKSKPLGDAWVWSRKQSTGDAALVVAMTLALYAGSEIPVDADDPVIIY
jgi:phage terminase large subunit-like protein